MACMHHMRNAHRRMRYRPLDATAEMGMRDDGMRDDGMRDDGMRDDGMRYRSFHAAVEVRP